MAGNYTGGTDHGIYSEARGDGQRHPMDGMKKAQALPFWGNGEALPKTERVREPDERGFAAIIKIFARTWPYLLPHIIGYWREVPRSRPAGDGEASDFAESNAFSEDASADGWSFRHVPPLVTVLSAIGPLTGWLPFGIDWPHDLLLAATVLMTILTWALLSVKGRVYAREEDDLVVLQPGEKREYDLEIGVESPTG